MSTSFDHLDLAHLYGVRVLTTFGWKYIGAFRNRDAAQAVADEARETGRYLRVRID